MRGAASKIEVMRRERSGPRPLYLIVSRVYSRNPQQVGGSTPVGF